MSSFLSGIPQPASVADTLPYFAPQPSRMEAREIDAFGCTDRGSVRERNEDQFAIAKVSRHTELDWTSLPADTSVQMWAGTEGRIFAVADGMGGHASGDVASTIVLQTMLEHVVHKVPWPGDEPAQVDDEVLQALARGLDTCQDRLAHLAESCGTERRKPGTTLTLGYLVWPTLYVLHVGDSRCYLFRPPRLVRVTSDHTMAQLLVDQDGADTQAARESPLGNVLMQAVGGGGARLDPELIRVHLREGDTLLLCSDGLTSEVSDEAIARELGRASSARECSRHLVEAAKRAGGRDNVTALVARF